MDHNISTQFQLLLYTHWWKALWLLIFFKKRKRFCCFFMFVIIIMHDWFLQFSAGCEGPSILNTCSARHFLVFYGISFIFDDFFKSFAATACMAVYIEKSVKNGPKKMKKNLVQLAFRLLSPRCHIQNRVVPDPSLIMIYQGHVYLNREILWWT